MKPAICKLQIKSLKTQLAANRLQFKSLANEFAATTNQELKAALATRLNRSAHENRAAKSAIALLENLEKEECAKPDPE